jgi:membrane-associated phospholipid phosphatase
MSLSTALEVASWWRGTYLLVALLVSTAVAFMALALTAHVVPYFEIDLQVAQAVQSVRNPILDRVAAWIAWPGFPPQSNVLFGALVLVLLACRQVLAALGLVVAAGGSAMLWFWIAPLVNRPRPTADLVHVSAELPPGSFPSGHVLNLTAGLGFGWYLAYTLLPRSPWRTAILWLVPIFLVVLGVARVYVGQHWPSDVVGGYLVGALWLWLCITTYRWLEKTLEVRRARRHQPG